MRPAALLTGLTGVVAVLVLVYVGLTAMNLEPHITFGDANRVVASADTGDLAKPPVAAATSAVPASTVPAAPAPAPIVASVEKPAAPAPQAEVPSPSVVAPQSSSAPVPQTAASSTPPVAPAPAVAAAANPPRDVAPIPAAAPQVASPAPLAPVVPAAPPAGITEATPATAVASAPSPVPVVAPQPAAPAIAPSVVAEAKPDAKPVPSTPPAATAVKPVEEAAKSETTDRVLPPAPSLPSLQTIPTPQARPEPPAVAEAKVVPEKPAEPATPAKAAPPVEEASLPPAEADAAKKPEAPSDTGLPTPEANTDLKPVDLSRPLAERAGVLTIGNKVVELAGIAPTDPARSCTGPNGKEWPCGTLARTALRAFLLGRTITCDVPDPQWKGPVTAECRFARVSLSDWLARNGWAEPVAGSPLMAVADEARKDGRGIYGNDPRKEHKSTLAPTPPPEDPLNPI